MIATKAKVTLVKLVKKFRFTVLLLLKREKHKQISELVNYKSKLANVWSPYKSYFDIRSAKIHREGTKFQVQLEVHRDHDEYSITEFEQKKNNRNVTKNKTMCEQRDPTKK